MSRPPTRDTELRTPPYGLRRLVALLLVVILGLLVWRSGAVGAFFGSGGPKATADGKASPSPTKGSKAPVSPTPSLPVAAVPDCTEGKTLTAFTDYQDWYLTFLDTRYRVTASYVPPDLVSTGRAGLNKGFLVRSIVIDDLTALAQAAAQARRPIEIAAAYRSFADQTSLYNRRGNNPTLLLHTAVPGHSEHQLGTTIDFKTEGELDVTSNWATTPTGRWMANHAYKYGFVMSYPQGKKSITCYPYEPWHFRYFGRDIAQRIHDSGVTVREFLWTLQPEATSP
jgi:D-alanyl-D-alanine carboxypeptidase